MITLKFHLCQKCYEISLKFIEISLKFKLNFTKVSIEISLKMTIEISEHYLSHRFPYGGVDKRDIVFLNFN